MTAILKVIMRLVAQRLDFIHPGESFVLVVVFFFTLQSGIIFCVSVACRFQQSPTVYQAELWKQRFGIIGKKKACAKSFLLLCVKNAETRWDRHSHDA